MSVAYWNWKLGIYYDEKVTPAQIREAEKSLKLMESMIEVMTPGMNYTSVHMRKQSYIGYFVYKPWFALCLVLIYLYYV